MGEHPVPETDGAAVSWSLLPPRSADVRGGETILGAFENVLCPLKKSGDLVFVVAGDALIGYRKRCIHALIVPVAVRKRR
jgi:hypothetical protein